MPATPPVGRTTGRRSATGKRWRVPAIVLAAVVVGSAAFGRDRDQAQGRDGEGDEPAVEAQYFVSRPDLAPPAIDVRVAADPGGEGLFFLAPKRGGAQQGPLIIDGAGEVVWSRPNDLSVTDFRVQRYRGEPVLTWYEGVSKGGYGEGEFVILDASYREVARVEAGSGFGGDLHEFQLTDAGTALVLAYVLEPVDLSAVGGPTEGYQLDNYVQEIDVETGEVVFEWSAAEHVPMEDTYSELVPDAAATEDERDEDGSEEAPFDWFHVNSVSADGDDTLLVSARNTHAVYAVDRRTGEVRWTLGGRSSDYELGARTRFAWQHDARRLPDGTISLFDNQAAPPLAERSRGLVLALDDGAGRARVVRQWAHEDDVLSTSQGNVQVLDDGGVVVGWGSEGRVTHYDRAGETVFDATWQPADSYRVYRMSWVGRPRGTPDVVARPDLDGVEVFVSWNGATEVAGWRVLGGDDPASLRVLDTVSRDGFETAVRIEPVDHLAVEALDASGTVIETSDTVTVLGLFADRLAR